MDRFSVAIVGGGVAAIEGLLRLRRLAGDAVATTLVAPDEEFVVRALTVKEPFALGAAQRHSLRRLTTDAGARWVRDRVDRIDAEEQTVHTAAGEEIGYDALLVALGGRVGPAYEHATTFRDDRADELLRGIVEDVEEGYSKRIAFVAPDGPTWPLPLYELALMTAVRAAEAGMDDVEVLLVTHEERPLAAFGANVSAAVSRLLADAGVTVHRSTATEIPAAGRIVIQPGGDELDVDRIVALPQMRGPEIRGLPADGPHGFVPVDERAAVRGLGPRVFAAGDATDMPIKHGGLSAQQADVAAAEIARLAGVEADGAQSATFDPVLRGLLLTGGRPLYMSAHMVAGEARESRVSDEPLWPSGEKVAAAELNAYLERAAST